MNEEPFVREISKEFDRYMDIMSTLERKSQNLIVASSTFIAILIGVIFIRSDKLPFESYYILIPAIILVVAIITSTLAIRVRSQIMPIHVEGFFTSRDMHGKKIGIDYQYLHAVILQTDVTLNMNDEEKKDYELNVEKKNVALQKWFHVHVSC